jgi:hypothetical protein
VKLSRKLTISPLFVKKGARPFLGDRTGTELTIHSGSDNFDFNYESGLAGRYAGRVLILQNRPMKGAEWIYVPNLRKKRKAEP